tara:strand:- start:203 stop:400 length:198 start_codon:yes stop_codon:yes gene_type:complete
MDTEMYSVASTIYNLRMQKHLTRNNYEYIINHKLKQVKKIIFIEERISIPFSETTAKILYLYFCP